MCPGTRMLSELDNSAGWTTIERALPNRSSAGSTEILRRDVRLIGHGHNGTIVLFDSGVKRTPKKSQSTLEDITKTTLKNVIALLVKGGQGSEIFRRNLTLAPRSLIGIIGFVSFVTTAFPE
jgi:hypothetical protein